jgi:hypothetical protein
MVYFLFVMSSWNVTAEGLLGEKIPRHGIGPGATAAADINIFTSAAVIFIPFKITKLKKKLRVLPDCFERSFENITGGFGKIAARLDLTIDIDEADELTGQAPFGSAG